MAASGTRYIAAWAIKVVATSATVMSYGKNFDVQFGAFRNCTASHNAEGDVQPFKINYSSTTNRQVHADNATRGVTEGSLIDNLEDVVS
jgi:hypothetical protein